MHLLHPDSVGGYQGWSTYPETPIHDLGYGSYRIWDNDCTWRALEISKGEWCWDRLDQIVRRMEDRGIAIHYVLGQPPLWATGGFGGTSSVVRYNPNPPDNIQDWRDYVAAVATRYSGRIGSYEIWNEFDLAVFWAGTDVQMIRLVQEASSIIRSIDSDAIICGPSISRACTENALSLAARIYSATTDDVDVVSVHPYDPRRPFQINRDINFLRAVVGKKPIWTTEFFNAVDAPLLPANDMEQAGQVVKTMVLNWVAGVQRAFWYQAGNPKANSNLIAPSAPSTILPSGIAFKHLADLLTGGFLYGYHEDGPRCSVEFVAGDGRTGRLMWSHPGVFERTDFSGYPAGLDVVGKPIELTVTHQVTPTPIYLFSWPRPMARVI